MRHNVYGKQLSRNTDERKRLIRNLMVSLIEHGAVKTSRAKAQAVRSEIEKMITKAKKGTDFSKRDLVAHLGDRVIAQTLIEMSGTRFAARTSGYTRIIKLGKRVGDATEEVLFSFVDEAVTQEVIAPKKANDTKTEVVAAEVKTAKKPVAKKAAKK